MAKYRTVIAGSQGPLAQICLRFDFGFHFSVGRAKAAPRWLLTPKTRVWNFFFFFNEMG